jgi:adenylate cyclase
MIVEGLENCVPRNSREQLLADRLHLGPQIRLACQTTITGNVTLRRLVLDSADIELASQLRPDKTPISTGVEKKIAILFADIRNFTPFAETLPPYDVIHVLNRYFYRMDKVIHQHGGFINNYMGDGLMALFGVDHSEETVFNAVKAALSMLEEVEKLKPYLDNVYGTNFNIGIGIHYGIAVLGSVGGEGQRRMTAIGDTVNMASRVEAANKLFSTRLLITEYAYDEIRKIVRIGRQFNDVKLQGKSGSYSLYEVISVTDNKSI